MPAMELVRYEPNAIVDFGNNFMEGLVAAAAMSEEAQRLSDQAGQANNFLSFEMMRAVYDLNERFDDVDIYKIFSVAKDVEKLNQKVLVHMGVLKRSIAEDDTVSYQWTSDTVRNLYEYTQELKDKDPAEHTRRFNNRKRLNMKLSEACKAACSLKDQGLKTDDMFYSEDPETKLPVPTIRNAPKQITGDKTEIQLGARKAVAGATMTPTMTSLVKLASEAHKVKEVKSKDVVDPNEMQEGHAKLGITDEDFGSIVNTLIRTINNQEYTFTPAMLKHLTSVQSIITDTLSELAKRAKAEEKQKKTA